MAQTPSEADPPRRPWRQSGDRRKQNRFPSRSDRVTARDRRAQPFHSDLKLFLNDRTGCAKLATAFIALACLDFARLIVILRLFGPSVNY
jgi:hypothetical protein